MQPRGEVVVLRVCQRVHRVDDDGLDAAHALLAHPQRGGDDGDAEGEGLAGAGACRHDDVLAGGNPPDGRALMLVERNGRGGGIAHLAPEDGRRLRMQHARRDERREGLARRERPRELDIRRLPQERPVLDALQHPRADDGVLELLEGLDIGAVFFLHAGEDVEGIDHR